MQIAFSGKNNPLWKDGISKKQKDMNKVYGNIKNGEIGILKEIIILVGYDSENITGLAFGLGVERIAMLRYGINDIRL